MITNPSASPAVLFVNGIPLVVIEAKAPGVVEPMVKAIRQLRRYANQRGSAQPEGNERLFHTSQFVVATLLREGARRHVHLGTRAFRGVEDHRAGGRG